MATNPLTKRQLKSQIAQGNRLVQEARKELRKREAEEVKQKTKKLIGKYFKRLTGSRVDHNYYLHEYWFVYELELNGRPVAFYFQLGSDCLNLHCPMYFPMPEEDDDPEDNPVEIQYDEFIKAWEDYKTRVGFAETQVMKYVQKFKKGKK